MFAGTVSSFKPVLPLNADSSREVRFSGRMTVVRADLLSCHGVWIFDAPYVCQVPLPVNVIFSIAVQFSKTGFLSETTQSMSAGTVSSFRFLQSLKADSPTEVTPSEIMAAVRFDLLSCHGVYSESPEPYSYQSPEDPFVNVMLSMLTQPSKAGA